MNIRPLVHTVLDLLYPLVYCDICQYPLDKGVSHSFCPACLSTLPLIRDPRCKKCGKPLREDLMDYCRDCQASRHLFTAGLSVYEYTQTIRDLIYRYKYQGETSLARTFGLLMGDLFAESAWPIDLVMPVPLHKRKESYRGFNQSSLLADYIAYRQGLAFRDDVLLREIDTDKQASLTRQDRMKNLKGAFTVVKPSIIKDKNILLIDDVYTTGATVDSCTASLKEAGAAKVFVLTLATGRNI
ncbi:MAG: ComF family protein [Caldicoprobacterales bacterium]